MTSSGRPKILVVDDEPDIAEVLRYNLEKADFEVLTSGDGAQAVELARGERPALVVLDLMLPGMDGEEVCRALRQDEGTRGTPILMLTAKGQEVDRIVGILVAELRTAPAQLAALKARAQT